jgi:glycosyltransferase involved in cell wall biosynthesis
MRVCLLTEGTYPNVRGGVSTWCHELIGGLPEIEFTVYALIGNPSSGMEYTLPPNVRRTVVLPLWGHERLAEYNHADLRSLGRRDRVALRAIFLPLFNDFLDEIVRGMESANPTRLVTIIGGLYRYFREHDYDWTMRQQEVWDATIHHFLASAWHARFMTSLEAVELTRSFYRYLAPLALEIPPCELIHTSAAGLCGLVAIAAKAVHGTPVVLTEHGVYLRERVLELARAGFPYSDRSIKKNLFSAITRATYAASDVIAPVCSYNSNWERFYGVPESRLRLIYNGVDETRFDDRESSTNHPTVAAMLRIDPLKDIETLVTSATHVRNRFPDVTYEIYGPIHDYPYNERVCALVEQLGLNRTIRFRGSTVDPAAAYADANVVALSSISEGFPYSVIEAMMCAKPVVATDVGGVREAIGEFGSVVPPKRPERLAEAICELLADPIRAAALGKGARTRALQFFTLRGCLASYRALYEELTTAPHEAHIA